METTKEGFGEAIRALGAKIGQTMDSGDGASISLLVGEPATEVVLEWIESARCVAVHSPFRVPEGVDRRELSIALMQVHAGGAATLGCGFFVLPDGDVRVGLTLVGPVLDEAQLGEALRRVIAVAQRPSARAHEMSPHSADT